MPPLLDPTVFSSPDGLSVVMGVADRLRAHGARYGDVRLITKTKEWLDVRNDAVDRAFATDEHGVGIRALVGDAWGFAAVASVEPAELERAVLRAVASARLNVAAATRPVDLGPANVQSGHWETPFTQDPFAVPAAEKIARLRALTRAMRATDPHVVSATATAVAIRTTTVFASTEGSAWTQRTLVTGGGIAATAHKAGDTQVRSYPKHFEGNVQAGGWERFDALNLEGHAERVATEAVALCTAPTCPAIPDATVVLDGSILSLQVHESCGHPTELDRAMGEEISLAGSSFLTTDRLGDFEYGSPLVTLYADGTTPLGAGTFGWDDEGNAARRTDLVRAGRFVGYLSGRESAQRAGVPTAASLRTTAFFHVPIVRMVNVNLEPGTTPLERLLAESDGAYLLSGPKSWSIDDRRMNFQFGCEAAWRIEGGKPTTLFKNPVYTGKTPPFWRGCDAIADAGAWDVWGYLDCGKGDPVQGIHVGHGVAPARFRGVELGSS